MDAIASTCRDGPLPSVPPAGLSRMNDNGTACGCRDVRCGRCVSTSRQVSQTTWTAAGPSTKGATPEPVPRGRTDRSILLMGSGKRVGRGVLLRRGRCSQRRSKIDRSVSVHQSRNAAGRASPYGSLHRGIPYYVAPTLPSLQTPHERLGATWQAAARYSVQSPAFVKRHSHLAPSRFFRGPQTAIAHRVRCAPVVRCCSVRRAGSAPAAPQSSVSRRPSAGFDRSI